MPALRYYAEGLVMTTRCEPPEAFRHHRWHWLQYKSAAEPDVFRWDSVTFGGVWCPHFLRMWRPEEAAAEGWSYYGPAIPPTEEKGK